MASGDGQVGNLGSRDSHNKWKLGPLLSWDTSPIYREEYFNSFYSSKIVESVVLSHIFSHKNQNKENLIEIKKKVCKSGTIVPIGTKVQ